MTHVVFTQLFHPGKVADDVEHLRMVMPRMGHSLVSDQRGSLWYELLPVNESFGLDEVA